MIANPTTQQTQKRFSVISEMSLGISNQAAQIKLLVAELEVERARANQAEAQVRQLEAQLTHPRYEATTLVHEIQGT